MNLLLIGNAISMIGCLIMVLIGLLKKKTRSSLRSAFNVCLWARAISL